MWRGPPPLHSHIELFLTHRADNKFFALLILQSIPDIVVYFYCQKRVLAWSLFGFFFFIGARREKDKRKRGVGPTRPGETQAANVKQVSKSLPAISRKARFVVAGFPFFFSCVRCARAFFFSPERAHARSPREVVEKTRAVFLCTGGRVEAAFQLKAAEFPCGKSPAPVPQLRSTVAVGPFCFPGHSRSTAGTPPPSPRERTRTTKAPGSTGSPLPSHSSFFPPILDKRSFVLLSPPAPPFHHLSGGILFEHGGCDEPGDEPPTPGVFPNAGRNHRRTGDTGSEAGTRNREIRPQGAAEETEPGGVDYRPANGPLRLRGKDTLTITGLRNPIESIDQRNWLRGSS